MFGLSRRALIGAIVGLLTIVIIVTVILIRQNGVNKNLNVDIKSSWEDKFVSNSTLGKFKKAAVSANGAECSKIGLSILEKQGSAVDAAITTLMCEGISSLHSSGLGGGFLMTIWDAKTGNAEFLNAKETAPAKASKNMFNGNANASRYGGLAIAVPGELAGYWAAHQKYGKLPWKDLFTPVIELCDRGALINPYIDGYLMDKKDLIAAEPTLAEILINPVTNSTWTTGDRVKRPKLRETLKILAEKGKDIFYNGTMGEEIVKEIQAFGGIIEMDDLRNYHVQWKEPITSKMGNLTMYTSNLPGSGVILTFILNVFEKFLPLPADEDIFFHHLVETFKWAYARRTELGDDSYADLEHLIRNFTSKSYADEIRAKIQENRTSNDPSYYGVKYETTEDAGTTHISILAPDGSAVAVTSSINQVLGSMRRSKSTGIIFNDQMDDFSSPNITNSYDLTPSPTNYIEPGKRPLSSMSPTIVVDSKGEVQLVIGAAGGTKITTSVALAMILNLWGGYNIKEAIDARRIHHQVLPMKVAAEKNFSPKILNFLRSIDHNVTYYEGVGSSITGISRLNHPGVTANADYRRYGSVSGF